jgi:FimV-like protein
MLNGLNKKKHLLILVVVSIAAFAFLFTRPKSVVKDENQTVQQNQKETSSKEAAHQLSPEAEALLQRLQQKAKTPSAQLEALSEIANLYVKESVFDSAGYYFEKIAKTSTSVFNWSNAADAYFQGFNLAIKQDNIDKLVEKTRICYNEVLKLEATNLHAKTNLAMTYVGSDNPMKAIGMLREVLDQEPKYIPAIMSLGGLSMQSNQYDKAALRFSNVLQIDPKNVNAKLGLAYSYIELGKKDEAKAILNQVITLDIDQRMKDEIAKTLNSLK